MGTWSSRPIDRITSPKVVLQSLKNWNPSARENIFKDGKYFFTAAQVHIPNILDNVLKSLRNMSPFAREIISKDGKGSFTAGQVHFQNILNNL